MATMATMVAMLSAKCPSSSSSLTAVPKLVVFKHHLPLSLPCLPRRLPVPHFLSVSSPPSTAVLAGAVFSALATSDAAFAVQQIAESSGSDNRGLALLLPILPAILWVLYNILQPALNQLSRMKAEKAVVAGLGLGAALAGLAAVAAPSASASGEVMMVADAASSSDSRGLLVLFVVAPAILWVLYNILQPALNQINRMRSG